VTAEASVDATSAFTQQYHQRSRVANAGRSEVVLVDSLLEKLEVLGLCVILDADGSFLAHHGWALMRHASSPKRGFCNGPFYRCHSRVTNASSAPDAIATMLP
jgi:hypothetical protein